MKTLIIYMSTHGCAKNVVHELSDKLNGETEIINLKEKPRPAIEEYDRVIIGGSIHAGQMQSKLIDFCEKNTVALTDKILGLFICCMYEGEEAYTQLSNAFPEKLHEYAKAEAIFGGEFNFEKMGFFEKLLVKKIAKVNQSVDKINHEAIEKFAKKMDKTFSPIMMLV